MWDFDNENGLPRRGLLLKHCKTLFRNSTAWAFVSLMTRHILHSLELGCVSHKLRTYVCDQSSFQFSWLTTNKYRVAWCTYAYVSWTHKHTSKVSWLTIQHKVLLFTSIYYINSACLAIVKQRVGEIYSTLTTTKYTLFVRMNRYTGVYCWMHEGMHTHHLHTIWWKGARKECSGSYYMNIGNQCVSTLTHTVIL